MSVSTQQFIGLLGEADAGCLTRISRELGRGAGRFEAGCWGRLGPLRPNRGAGSEAPAPWGRFGRCQILDLAFGGLGKFKYQCKSCIEPLMKTPTKMLFPA